MNTKKFKYTNDNWSFEGANSNLVLYFRARNLLTEENYNSVKEIIGKDTDYVGFYSYREISPINSNSTCELHNQTMTITTYSEN